MGTLCWGYGERSLQLPRREPLGGARAPWQASAGIGLWRPGVCAGGLMRPRPSPAVLSALVTGESLERLRRGLAAGTSNLGSPTESTDQLLPPGGGRGREVLDLEEADLDLFRAAFSSKPQALATPSKEERGKRKKKGKGLGKKRDPCLRKYKDFCIHGECKYVKELRAPSCM